jgi:hypothetical protein
MMRAVVATLVALEQGRDAIHVLAAQHCPNRILGIPRISDLDKRPSPEPAVMVDGRL